MHEKIIENADTINASVDADRLGELIAADQDGRCKVLPCHAGDVVWLVSRNYGTVLPATVTGFHFFENCRDTLETLQVFPSGQASVKRWKFSQWGRVIFPSEEEARAALAQQK